MPNLVVLVMHDVAHLSEIIDAWHGAGAPAATILDCTGTRAVREGSTRDDIPLFPSLHDLFKAGDVPRKTIFSVVPNEEAVDRLMAATRAIMGDLAQPRRGIFFSMPVLKVMGLRDWEPGEK